MEFKIFMFICNLIIPILMIITSCIIRKKPPKKINDFYGYRTQKSKMNIDTWTFAQKHFSKLWNKIGFSILGISILIQIPFINASENVFCIMSLILCIIQCIIIIISITQTERALKINFDNNGQKINKN